MDNWRELRNYKKRKNKDGSYTYTVTVDGRDVVVSEVVYKAYKKGGRKMEYMEYDMKRETWEISQERQSAKCIPSREDSYERLIGEDKQFAQDDESVENAAIKNIMLDKLPSCLDRLDEDERALIDALFFENDGEGISETALAARYGITRQAIHRRLLRVLRKLEKYF